MKLHIPITLLFLIAFSSSLRAQDAREHAPIRGQVIDIRSGQGVSGFAVTLKLNGVHLQRTTSDATGHFSLRPVATPNTGWVAVKAPVPKALDWQLVRLPNSTSHQLTQAELDGSQALKLAVSKGYACAVRGIAVSKRTGAALAFHRFRIQSRQDARFPWSSIEVESDAHGAFQTSELAQAAQVRMATRRNQASAIEPASAYRIDLPLRIEFKESRRLEFKLTGVRPQPSDKLRVYLLQPDGGPLASVELREAPLGVYWARLLRPTHRGFDESQAALLALADEEGLLFGSRPFSWSQREAPLGIELKRCAKLEYDLEPEISASMQNARLAKQKGVLWSSQNWNPTKPPKLSNVNRLLPFSLPSKVSLKAAQGSAFPAQQWRLKSWRWLPPGIYHAAADSRIHQPLGRSFELVAGELSKWEATLLLKPGLRQVTGRLRSAAGSRLENLSLDLWVKGAPEARWNALLQRDITCVLGFDEFITVNEVNGTEVGTWTFPAVPPGKLLLVPQPAGSNLGIEVTENPDGSAHIEVLQLSPGQED